MRRPCKPTWILLLSFLTLSQAEPLASALVPHGLKLHLSQEGRTVVAFVSYEGGIPARGAEVRVTGPEGGGFYLVGVTDPAGLFAFVPDQPGEWRVAADDGRGHRVETMIHVQPPETLGPLSTSEPEPEEDFPFGAAVTGLSLIVALAGFAYGVSKRRHPS